MRLLMILTAALWTLIGCTPNHANRSFDPPEATQSQVETPPQDVLPEQDPRCPQNQNYTARGCLPGCGTGLVIKGGQCVSASDIQPIDPSAPQTPDICRGECDSDQIQMAGTNKCLPQYICPPCYGFANGSCYISVNAHEYYGY